MELVGSGFKFPRWSPGNCDKEGNFVNIAQYFAIEDTPTSYLGRGAYQEYKVQDQQEVQTLLSLVPPFFTKLFKALSFYTK